MLTKTWTEAINRDKVHSIILRNCTCVSPWNHSSTSFYQHPSMIGYTSFTSIKSVVHTTNKLNSYQEKKVSENEEEGPLFVFVLGHG